MAASVDRISHETLWELISTGACGSLSDIDREKFKVMGTISNELWAGTVDDKLVCLWGLAPPTLLSEEAYIWLWTSEVVDEHKFLFVRASQRWVEQALERYPVLVGYTESANHRAIQWITWLGGRYRQIDGRLSFRIEKDHGRSNIARA